MGNPKETDPMTMEKVRNIVEKNLVPRDRYLYGFANLTGLVEPHFGIFKYGISIGQHLDQGIMDSIQNGPTPEYLDHYKQTNQGLSRLSGDISSELNQIGVETICIEPSISTDKLENRYGGTLRTNLSHKMVATRAGLGWIGKTALLITREFGPRLRLVSILTSIPLVPALPPVNKSKCGKCDLCVVACPASAATGQLWNVSLDRDAFFDAGKCREKCAEFGKKLISSAARICGICVSVCPIGNYLST